jgi:hypothetical protein
VKKKKRKKGRWMRKIRMVKKRMIENCRRFGRNKNKYN